MRINLLAATEIARQLRLRDMGGIIVVDFIDMSEPIQRKLLYEHLKKKMEKDRTKHKILTPKKFGLVQLTRHRVRPELKVNINNEKSKDSPINYIHRLEFVPESILKNKNHQKMQLNIHSFVSAYLKKEFPSIQQKLLLKYKKWIQIIPRDSFGYTEYQVINEKHEIVSSSFH